MGTMPVTELYPKDILGSVFTKNALLAEIAVKARFPNAAMGAKRILGILADLNINVIALNLTNVGDRQYIISFIDYSGIQGGLKDVIEKIKKTEYVEDVRLETKKISEKIIDRFSTPTFSNGQYEALIVSKDEFSQVFTEIKKSYGSGGEAFLYMLGYKLGRLCGEKYKPEKITADFIKEDVLIFQAFGWGIPEIVHLDLVKPKIIIRFYNLFESAFIKEKRKKTYCHFFRGFITGLFSEFLAKELFTKEVKCVAMGDSCCEFVVEEQSL